jgi:hypothetical protein
MSDSGSTIHVLDFDTLSEITDSKIAGGATKIDFGDGVVITQVDPASRPGYDPDSDEAGSPAGELIRRHLGVAVNESTIGMLCFNTKTSVDF